MFWQNLFKFKRPEPPPPIIDTPTEAQLKQWARSQWIEYQAWIFHHSFLTWHDWQQLRTTAINWEFQPLISVITPVYNTPPSYLRECIYSVQTQAYPYWELCLVDDGSDNLETLAGLQELVSTDPRLKLHRLPHNQGICQATNQGLTMAQGEYVVFLDHDDRLATDAFYHLVATWQRHPDCQIIYTDRDMLSAEGHRFMHLFKPDWSPETLLSGNYLFHLLAYRTDFIKQLGGMRIGLEGSQDYDLILRAADTHPIVYHIPKILYHWRQHQHSVALEHNAKEYAYHAGIRALQDTLTRRGLVGTVTENDQLWRGHYRVQLQPPPKDRYQILNLTSLIHYAYQVNQAFVTHAQIESLIIFGPTVQTLDSTTLDELTAWLQIPTVGIVTGKVTDSKQQFLHAGLVHRANGIPLAVYTGFPEPTPGYMAFTAIVRNLSAPHPACCVIKRSLWQRLNGLNSDYQGPHALFDFALRALELGLRTVYTPFVQITATEWPIIETWPESDRLRFTEHWSPWLTQGDPYYNPYLTLELNDMGLNTQWPPAKVS